MRTIGSAILALALPLLTASGGAAESGRGALDVVQHIFDVADEDGDGSLTRSEYEGAGLQRFGVSFDECDANDDGATSIEEYRALYDRYHPPEDRLPL